MPKDPWTDPDPQPGDFDEYIERMDPRDAWSVEPEPGRTKVIRVKHKPNSLAEIKALLASAQLGSDGAESVRRDRRRGD